MEDPGVVTGPCHDDHDGKIAYSSGVVSNATPSNAAYVNHAAKEDAGFGLVFFQNLRNSDHH